MSNTVKIPLGIIERFCEEATAPVYVFGSQKRVLLEAIRKGETEVVIPPNSDLDLRLDNSILQSRAIKKSGIDKFLVTGRKKGGIHITQPPSLALNYDIIDLIRRTERKIGEESVRIFPKT